MQYRTEHDSMGEIQVPADRYWGAQTQRSFENLNRSRKDPMEIIRAFAILKRQRPWPITVWESWMKHAFPSYLQSVMRFWQEA